MTKEIESDKIIIQKLFEKWFRVPEYQRPYVWLDDQINSLLDDIKDAALKKDDEQYFMGSMVLHTKKKDKDRYFEENDLLDGQQRVTTIMMIFAVVRDMTSNKQRKEDCQNFIFQQANPDRKIPERIRILYDVRKAAKEFILKYVMEMNGTLKDVELNAILINDTADLSVRNMANAILLIKKYFETNKDIIALDEFYPFLINNVVLIYVSTDNLDDAFKMFTVLNARGLPLRSSDILKAQNLGALQSETEKKEYAEKWEEIESILNEDFDRFLSYIRTIIVRERARLNLLKEFEDIIYFPKEKDKLSGILKKPLLKRGKDTLNLINEYFSIYEQLFIKDNLAIDGTFAFDNLVEIMIQGIPSTDWVPPLLYFYKKYNSSEILKFTKKLICKFSGDWISGETPTTRIENMNKIIKLVEDSNGVDEVINSDLFKFDADEFKKVIDGNIYKRKFCVFLLLLLDFIFKSVNERFVPPNIISIEHILPQTPKEDSKWILDFNEQQRLEWTDKLGNLVLISKAKNSSQGRSDYVEKKSKYFKNKIESFANSLHVLNTNEEWKFDNLIKNHTIAINKISELYGI